ncbi:hypothetical protein Nepgr_030597 [Nepenthes gracilis]|uniref:Uncharacterized protein n=1 Tax=Nepenthes gracilis TaxID=150966 RepID=A0AAD3Y677_NEPGR|nr:hypothetical protein Nepgr_030597 [Nepenthes gracilis]
MVNLEAVAVMLKHLICCRHIAMMNTLLLMYCPFIDLSLPSLPCITTCLHSAALLHELLTSLIQQYHKNTHILTVYFEFSITVEQHLKYI